ncbi:MAG: hypothetical protein LBC84_07870 [Prevotellaceae bacterium]|jgi:predicted Zn-dependent protease|nr:hypothetical protein [Prevotellaceae bacterium]
MSKTIKITLLFFGLFLGLYPLAAQSDNPVINAIQKEVDRNMTSLKMEGMAPPFFISYSVFDRVDYTLSASLGTISSTSEIHQRRGMPTLLVGNYHRNNLKVPERAFSPSSTTLIDNTTGVPITIWRDLDGVYKSSVETYRSKMAILQQQTQTQEEKDLPDFEQVKQVHMIAQPVSLNFNKAYWENYLRKVSETAKQYPDILNSNVSLTARSIMTYTYNTEGSRYTIPYTFYQLTFTANTRAEDGQDLSQTVYEENATFEQMPDLVTFTNQCKAVMENLLKLKNAHVVNDAYSGPVLFEGKALYILFVQAFLSNNKLAAAPKLAQLPQSQSLIMVNGVLQLTSPQLGGNDFELMLNKKVISRDLSIKSITGQEFYNGKRLNGYYPIDAEGVVPAKELMLIENGVLRNLLNGRKPTNNIRESNGHVRFDYNANAYKVTAGNIHITCNQTFSNDELYKKLIAAAKEEDLEYAYIVRIMSGGDSFFYKVYVEDGREELVRGAAISDATSLRPFKRILGASNIEQIESYGFNQSSVISPNAILFEEMDITRLPNIEFKKPYIVPKP